MLIVVGSKSDLAYAEEASKVLEELSIPFEVVVSSAHRDPEATREIAVKAKERGFKVIIAMAGYAAHLPGFMASFSSLPVIGVPLDTSPLKGIDSILSIAQMPSGVPVATMGVGKAGARNAALFAHRILSIAEG